MNAQMDAKTRAAASNSRQQILNRIHAATGKVPNALAAYNNLSRDYIRHGTLSTTDCIQRMIERLREYDAEVVECSPAELPGAIAMQLAASGKRIFAAPARLPTEWLSGGLDWKIDHNQDHSLNPNIVHNIAHSLTISEIEATEGVVTAATAGIAESGTIVLLHSASEGRRILTLLPDWHLCILRASQIVETLPEFFDNCPQTPTLATLISGPSATADIEMTRIKGVHGPRFLHVILVHDKI